MTARTSTFPTGLKAVVGLLFAALFFFGLHSPVAHAAGPIDVTVKLTTKDGKALSNVFIYAYQAQYHGAKPDSPVVESVANGTGKYLLSGLVPGQPYALYFDAPSSTTTAFDQFYGGTTWIEEAQTLTWSASSTLEVSLATNSSITGTVKGVSSALSGVTVYPIRFDGSQWYELYGKRTTTSSTGAYAIRNLEPGSYKVAFLPNNTSGYLPEFSGNAAHELSATPVYVGLGSSATASATLAKGGTINGSVELVISGSTKESPSDVMAYAYPWTGTAIDTSAVYLSKPTTSTGKWSVAGLPPGEYKVKLYDLLGNYPSMWATDKFTVASANKYTIVGTGSATAGESSMVRDLSDQAVTLNITHNAVAIHDENATVFIESNDGEDFFYYLTPQDTAEGIGLASGSVTIEDVPAGSFEVTIDSGLPGVAPSVTTQTKGSSSTTWNVALADASLFTWNTVPTLNIGGTSFGSTISVTPATTSLDPVAYSYIWLRDGRPIYGSTAASYTVRASDAGREISVIVRAEKSGYPPLIETLTGPTIPQGAAPVATTLPAISPATMALPGDTLTASPGAWNVDPLSYAYEWQGPGGEVLGTGRTYQVKPTDVGQNIYVYVTASGVGRPASAPTAGVSMVEVGAHPAPVLKKAPSITSSKSGSSTKYTVSKGSWSPTTTTVQFRFSINGGAPVATNTTGVFTCTSVSCPPTALVEVQLTAMYPGSESVATGYVVRKATSAAAPAPLVAGIVDDSTVAGTSALGASTPVELFHTLTATPPTYTYPSFPGTLKRTYQWQNSIDGTTWKSITTAKSVTYTPLAVADLNKYLRVLVTTTSNFGTYADPQALTAGRLALNQSLNSGPGNPGITMQGNNYVNRDMGAVLNGPAVAGVDYEFRWYECDATTLPCVNSGAPLSSNWTLVASDTQYYTADPTRIGWKVTVGYHATKSGYAPADRIHGSTTMVAEGTGAPFPFIHPKIVSGLVGGKAVVGTTLTATHATWDKVGTIVTPYWQYCPMSTTCSPSSGWAVVPGDPKTVTYKPSAELVELSNGRIRYIEFGTFGASSNPAWTPDLLLQPLTLKQTKSASFKKSGSNWVVSPGTWTSGTTFTYQWYVGDTAAAGQTSKSYAVTSTGPVYVKITAHKSGYTDVVKRVVTLKGTPTSTTSALTNPVYATSPMELANPIFTFGMAAPEVKTTYQWYSGSSAISGKKSATLTPSSSYIGKTLKLKVTVSSPLYNTTSKYSTSVVFAAHPAPAATAAIESDAGTFVTGATLSANKGGFPSGTAFTYKWERSDDGLGGWSSASTMSTYQLSSTDVDKYFRVSVVGKKTGWVTAPAVVSSVIQSHVAPKVESVGPIQITSTGGVPRVGSPLTVGATWNTSGVSVSYDWYRNGVKLPGVAGSTWTPLAGSLDDEIYVVIAVTKPGYVPALYTTHKVSVGEGTAPATSTKPAISGMTGSGSPKAPKAGDVLKATPGVWNVDGLTFTYSWKLSGGAIVGTESSYQVQADDVGTITVEVSTDRVGWADGASISAATKAIQP